MESFIFDEEFVKRVKQDYQYEVETWINIVQHLL